MEGDPSGIEPIVASRDLPAAAPWEWLQSALFRRKLVRMARRSHEWHPRTVRDGKVTQGRDGWLFIADDANDAFAQHTGALRLSPDKLEQWNQLVESRLNFLDVLDCRYLMMVAPDTHAVYPEKLPPGTALAVERPVHQLMRSAYEGCPTFEILYPLEAMTAGKGADLVCSPVDSHWTAFGAFLAYSELLEALSRTHSVRRVERAEVAFYDIVIPSDLGIKLQAPRVASQPLAILRFPEARLLYDNCVEGTGSVVVTECPVAPKTTCLLLGDSYSYPLLYLLSESFRRVVLVHSTSLDRALVEEIRPDVVLNLMAERFLIKVPSDDRAGQSDQERKKRAARSTRPPLAYWSWRRSPSPAWAERLRERFLAADRLREATIVSLLSYAGLRPRELLRLRWSDVGEREIYVRQSAARRSMEASRPRTVRMIEPLVEDLRAWQRELPEATPRSLVIPGSRGPGWAPGEWDAWTAEYFNPAVRACGIDLERPHDLNQIFCALQILEGASMRQIARQTGNGRRDVKAIVSHFPRLVRKLEPADVELLVRAARRPSPAPADDVRDSLCLS